MNFWTITKECKVKKYLNAIQYNILIIYSETSIRKNKINLDRYNFTKYSTKQLTIQKENIDSTIKNLDNIEIVISIGGGTAIDIGKYLSKKYNKKMICIPTMLSTNAYSTNKVALYIDGAKRTLDAILPNEILFDSDILKKSKENNLYGLIDIFSIYTALRDWRLASKYNSENITKEYNSAEMLLRLTIKYVQNTKLSTIKNDAKTIYRLIGESGEITNQYGSGKPESGSEHIFAKSLENKIEIPHAIAVANGILLMATAQSLYMNENIDMLIFKLIKKLNIYKLNIKYNISYDLVKESFLNLYPREDRFTIINLIKNYEKVKNQVLIKYKKLMLGSVLK